jgi:Predicted acyl-CoA transferases/carnitine dehydratase
MGAAQRQRHLHLLPLGQSQQEGGRPRHGEGRAGPSWCASWCAAADIVVENFMPKSLQRLGLDYESLRALNPRIIHCSISGYGRDGPLADRPAMISSCRPNAG